MIYPCVLTGCIGLFFVLANLETGLLVSTYVPVFLGAFFVMGFERLTPHRNEWAGRMPDIVNDALYMFVVQVLLPLALTFLCALAILKSLESYSLTLSVWPSEWHIGLQIVLMVLIADFLRYWLHRRMHASKLLWKFHAVHHSPKKLYWLNVGRFHPVDKSLQFLLDAMPFIVMGVGQDVVALYFVFYSINGFFQHCNIELQMGPLNYVISGPQLHRWHHSRVAEEANSNYGNNLIIWDILFGTYYFPRQKQVGELGLLNRNYPLDFVSQMQTPFSGNIDRSMLPVQTIADWFINVLFAFKMGDSRRKLYEPLVNNSKDVKGTQLHTLRQILRRNADTEFGLKHEFGSIHDYDDFKMRVPVHEYENLRPYIEKQENTRIPVLTSQLPIMYNQTSGTTGSPKYIPVLQESLDSLKETQNVFVYLQYKFCPEAYSGRILAMTSPDTEDHLETGTPVGSASGHLYKYTPWLARKKFVIPNAVFAIPDYEVKYLVICRLAFERNDITLLVSPNPSTFHKLLEITNANLDELISDIATGTCRFLDEVDSRTRDAVRRQLRRNPERASEIETLANEKDHISFAAAWPYLKLVTTWTGGSCGISLDAIRPEFPGDVRVLELGYLSSEFRGTITIDPDSNEGLPTISENFFEFVQKNDWEQARQIFLPLHQLENSEEYYVFITTATGLYRYNMNDIIRVGGRFHSTPTLRFSQKGKGVTNITGEKLYENQLIGAMQSMSSQFGVDLRFYQALADENQTKYKIYIELAPGQNIDSQAVAKFIDASLRSVNMEYESKRESGRLGALEVLQLKPGASEAYKLHYLATGQRESQFKPMILQNKKDFSFDILGQCMP